MTPPTTVRSVVSALACATLALMPLTMASAVETSGDGAQPAALVAAPSGAPVEFLVLAKKGASHEDAHAAVTALGGEVVEVNGAIGLLTVRAPQHGFAEAAAAQSAIAGVSHNVPLGRVAESERVTAESVDGDAPMDEAMAAERKAAAQAIAEQGQVAQREATDRRSQAQGAAPQQDSMRHLQWDLDVLKLDQVHAITQGQGVKVGIMDTGVDASHPDIAPNFNHALSKNFTKWIPEMDGECKDAPEVCDGAADADSGRHGTHVAGTVAAAANGRGVVGVAPKASIVNLRVAQRSGQFLTKSVADAMVYAGDHGINVVNMSFYIDPWMFNCPNNPADSPAEQMQQRNTIEITQRAVDYARSKGVTFFASTGNSHIDRDQPTLVDKASPNFPPNSKKERLTDKTCKDMPVEADGVLGVGATGPSGVKSDYSSYGRELVDFAAPGGYYRDNPGTDKFKSPSNLILSTIPAQAAIEDLKADGMYNEETGESKDPFTPSECPSGKDSCAYYGYFQGTSMAAPHASGVGAIVIGKHGQGGERRKWMSPWELEFRLKLSAERKDCPAADFVYPERTPDWGAQSCVRRDGKSNWYGYGVVNPLRAVVGSGK